MEAKEIRDYLNKHENTKTYIINMCAGLCVFLLLSGIAKVVSAQEPVATTVAEENSSGEFVLSERSRDRILALADNMADKMRGAIERHAHITNRLEQRLELMETNGELLDLMTYEQLEAAKNARAEAQSIVESELDTLVDNTVYSETPKENWLVARARYQDAARLIRESYQMLNTALSFPRAADTQESTN